MECLDDRLVHGLAGGTLDAGASLLARAHIDACDSCRDLVATVAAVAASPPPETIGRYQIEAMIGSGAMGIVYAAVDPQLERNVAIKMLRGDQHRDRLLREARAAAQISHPNVIAVFDAGVADGEVFMAMELIRGRTLRQWNVNRSWRDIIEIAIKAGRGLAAIHRAGLVHRDVKPDNVLVADDGRIVVTDLGLVRVEPGTASPETLHLTQTGVLVGTPVYAAPEQLDGPAEIDARADQFSFCVTTYEALAGRRPFEAETIDELRAAIERGAARLDAIPRRIDAAIARGLAVDPAQRWPDLDALVGELERALAPRRRIWLAAGALGLAAAGATAYVATRSQPSECTLGAGEIAQVWNPVVRAKIAAAFAGLPVAYASSTWRATASFLDSYTTRWATAYDQACSATNVRHVQSPAVLVLRAQCLDRRRTELAALLDVLAKPDADQAQLAATAANALTSPEVCADGELLSATEPVPDDPTRRRQVSAARVELARISALSASGKYKQAVELARGASAAATKLGYAPLVAEIDAIRGRIAMDLQTWDEAKSALDSALLAAERGRHHWVRGDVELGLVYYAIQRNEPEQALAELKRAEAVATGLGAMTKNRAKLEDYRAVALAQLNQLDDAKGAALRAIELYERSEGKDTISLASPLTQLAYVEHQRGNVAGAVTYVQRALTIQERALGVDHPRVGIAHVNLAFNLSAIDRFDEARQHAERAREILKASVGESSPAYAEASRALFGVAMGRNDFAGAERIAREIVAGYRARKDTSSVRYGNAVEDLAAALIREQRHDDALPLFREALAVREHSLPAGHPSIVATQIEIADALADLEHYDEALALYTRAQQSLDHGDAPPYLGIGTRLGRGRCQIEQHHPAAAILLLRDALDKIGNPTLGEDRQQRGLARFLLAQALAATGKAAAARELATAARDELAEVGDKHAAERVDGWLAKRAR